MISLNRWWLPVMFYAEDDGGESGGSVDDGDSLPTDENGNVASMDQWSDEQLEAWTEDGLLGSYAQAELDNRNASREAEEQTNANRSEALESLIEDGWNAESLHDDGSGNITDDNGNLIGHYDNITHEDTRNSSDMAAAQAALNVANAEGRFSGKSETEKSATVANAVARNGNANANTSLQTATSASGMMSSFMGAANGFFTGNNASQQQAMAVDMAQRAMGYDMSNPKNEQAMLQVNQALQRGDEKALAELIGVDERTALNMILNNDITGIKGAMMDNGKLEKGDPDLSAVVIMALTTGQVPPGLPQEQLDMVDKALYDLSQNKNAGMSDDKAWIQAMESSGIANLQSMWDHAQNWMKDTAIFMATVGLNALGSAVRNAANASGSVAGNILNNVNATLGRSSTNFSNFLQRGADAVQGILNIFSESERLFSSMSGATDTAWNIATTAINAAATVLEHGGSVAAAASVIYDWARGNGMDERSAQEFANRAAQEAESRRNIGGSDDNSATGTTANNTSVGGTTGNNDSSASRGGLSNTSNLGTTSSSNNSNLSSNAATNSDPFDNNTVQDNSNVGSTGESGNGLITGTGAFEDTREQFVGSGTSTNNTVDGDDGEYKGGVNNNNGGSDSGDNGNGDGNGNNPNNPNAGGSSTTEGVEKNPNGGDIKFGRDSTGLGISDNPNKANYDERDNSRWNRGMEQPSLDIVSDAKCKAFIKSQMRSDPRLHKWAKKIVIIQGGM